MPSYLVPLLASFLVLANPPTDIQTSKGTVRGAVTSDGQGLVFKGIPYAAPPVGALRWASPAPAAGWRGVRAADRFGADCPQPALPGQSLPLERIDEDCLYLNIWKPAVAAKPLPVMVWIYGGSFVGGGTSDPQFDGARLAERGVVLVTINYRTGALGFMAHPALTKASPTHASGNYGVMDVIAALRFVRENAAAFGGDPARVTVFGQSAGAVMVNMLMAAPSAKGLFARGIIQSGPLFGLTPAMREAPVAEAFGARFMAARGSTDIAAMRRLPWQALQDLTTQEKAAMLLPFAPIADGVVLPRTTTHSFQAEAEAPVPLIIGSIAQENSSSVPKAYTSADFEAWVRQVYGVKADRLLPLWPHATDAEARASRVQLRSYAINEGSQYEALLHARLQPKTWIYRFDRYAPAPDAALYGADHGSDVAYTFDGLVPGKRRWEATDHAVSADLIGYWVNFARTGDPNGPGLPVWPTVGAAPGRILHFGDVRTVAPVNDLDRLGLARRHEDEIASSPQ